MPSRKDRVAGFFSLLNYIPSSQTYNSESPELRIRRDKAFTIAKKLVDELNAHARCILRNNRVNAEEFMVAAPRKKPARKVAETVKA